MYVARCVETRQTQKMDLKSPPTTLLRFSCVERSATRASSPPHSKGFSARIRSGRFELAMLIPQFDVKWPSVGLAILKVPSQDGDLSLSFF